MNVLNWVLLGMGAALSILGFFMRRSAAQKLKAVEAPTKKQKRPRTLWTVVSILGAWLTVVELLTWIFGPGESKGLSVEISAPRVELFGLSISTTILVSWAILLVLTVLAVLIRLLVIPKMTEVPHGFQNVLELCVEEVAKFTESKASGLGELLGGYIFTLAVFMVSCAAVELLGVRAPTSDLTMTFAMALVTFVLINYYGIRKRGLAGRIKGLASPTPVVLPFRIISDIATPVSLACRLFGNMLGGMIVMDLLYTAMGNMAVGIPSILGLYFNVFHPLIQTFIFVTLTLTFINEATEG